MGNCLVTKLSGSVDNENLPVFETLKLKVTVPNEPDVNYAFCSIVAEGQITVFLSDNTKTMYDINQNPIGPTVTNSDIRVMLKDPGTYNFFIKNKYAITELNQLTGYSVSQIDLKELEYLTLLTKLKQSGNNIALFKGNVKYLKGLPLAEIVIDNASDVEGSFTDLGFLSSLSNLKIGNSKVTGSIEGFVAANRGKSRTSYTFEEGKLPYLGSNNITFNGTRIANQASNSLSWTASTITFNGTEIQNSDVIQE